MRNKFNKMNYSVGSLWVACVLGFAWAPRVEAQDNVLDGKLVKYMQDAKKSGQKQSQAEQKAMKAGWPAAAVSQAGALVYRTSGASLASSTTPTNGGASSPPAPSVSASAAAPGATSLPPIIPGPTQGSSQTAVKTPAGATASAAGSHTGYEYQIGAGDTLKISVWKEPEASADVVVRPDGIISTPLIREIQVAGLTPTQAETLITEKLVKVIQEPDVTVVVTGINSKKIYTIGGVKKEGTIPYTYSMTVMQAIAEAGGLTDYAKRKKIYVLRTEKGKDSRFPFNYDEFLNGGHPEQNIVMLPGDTLMVPH